jgi:hypothetical protein
MRPEPSPACSTAGILPDGRPILATLERRTMKAGTRIRYADVNLHCHVGTVVDTSGSFATVRWDRGAVVAREWIPNLAAIPDPEPAGDLDAAGAAFNG